MIFEIAEIEVKVGEEAAFEASVRQAAPLIKAARGYRSLALHRLIERPSAYRLIVGWDTVDNHIVDFRNSDAFPQWRALVGPYFAAPPRVEHMATVVELD
jgi:heme-degrading monooxygenase HmoA